MFELKIYPHSIGQNSYHLIFRTKYNLKFFRHHLLRESCEQFLREAAQKHKIEIYTIKVLPDHVHLFVELPPTISVSNAVKFLKGYSAREFFKRYKMWKYIIQQGHKKAHLWSRWRFSRSVGAVRTDVIEHYIRNSTHNQISAYRARQTALC